MKTIKNSTIEVTLHEEQNLISSFWLTPPGSKEFRAGTLVIYKLILDNPKVDKLLINCVNMGVTNQEDQQWAANEYMNNYYDASKKLKTAIILPEDIFTQMCIDEIKDTIKAPNNTQYFKSSDLAQKWFFD